MSTVTPLRWGILATGKIAHRFADDLTLLPDAEIAAVGARSQASADAFAADYDVPRAHPSYEALAADPDVDVVYVASPHGLHHDHVRMLLEAGKPVLCEKAITLNAGQAEELFALAEEKGLFLMEAMWMACHPLVRHLRERIAAGEFGSPRQLVADLGFVVDAPASDRKLAPELGGGALLDVGIYPLTLAQLFLGSPRSQQAVAAVNEQGIDLDVAIVAEHADGAIAVSTGSFTGATRRDATLATDTGRLEIPADFHHPTHAIWHPAGGEPVRIDPPEPVIGTGLAHEAIEVMRALRAGETTSPVVPPEQTLDLMRQMDAIRAQVGVRYPGE